MPDGTLEVLLVEDNPADAQLICSVLESGPCPKHLSSVVDGELAIEFLERQGSYVSAPRPDLIILDLRLPKVDGNSVLAYIKSSPSLRQIPVVILSSSARDQDVDSAYDLHANCYLTKPLDLDDYVDMVQKIEEYWLTQVQLC